MVREVQNAKTGANRSVWQSELRCYNGLTRPTGEQKWHDQARPIKSKTPAATGVCSWWSPGV